MGWAPRRHSTQCSEVREHAAPRQQESVAVRSPTCDKPHEVRRLLRYVCVAVAVRGCARCACDAVSDIPEAWEQRVTEATAQVVNALTACAGRHFAKKPAGNLEMSCAEPIQRGVEIEK